MEMCEEEKTMPTIELAGEEDCGIPSTEISMHALLGAFNPRTLRILGYVKGKEVTILINNRSTNNFVQDSIVGHLGLDIEAIPQFDVFVGSGASIPCSGVCRRVAVLMQNITILEDIYVLKMEGANLVLGCQCLEKLGPITTNQRKLTMEFEGPKGKIRLKGDPHLAETTLSENSLKRMTVKGRIVYYCQFICESKEPTRTAVLSKEVMGIIVENDSLFAEPDEMPHERRLNHRINLAANTAPINMHHYHYPQFQKSEIEKLTCEMLNQGLIRLSSSPFSSPVLLVRKKDGNWRFCVDYRALNAATIRDRFRIPTMDELIDELHGAVIFSKLDLRAVYHQIRIEAASIYKTTF